MDKRRAVRLLPVAAVLAAAAAAAGLGWHGAPAPVGTVTAGAPVPVRLPVRAAAVMASAAPVHTAAPTAPLPSTTTLAVPPQPRVADVLAGSVGTRSATTPTVPVTRPYDRSSGRVGTVVRPASVDPSNPLDGLNPLPAGWSATAHTITVGGLDRTYLTVAPGSLGGSVPVVVLMHGVDMTPAGILNTSELAAQIGPAVLLVPEGWQESWNAGGCCGAAGRAGIDDVGFIQAAVAQVLAANPAANPQRVYAVGFSNGGRMAYRLACELPGLFSGFLAAEAVPVQTCTSRPPIDEMILAQQNDPLLTIPADEAPKSVGGVVEPTVAATIAHQETLDGCTGPGTVTYAGQAEMHTWSCASGTSLTYVWFPGGAHTWRRPSGATPGATDMVLSLLGGQRLTDQAAPPPAPVS